MTRHLSTRSLARYSAGAFGVRKAARITTHLAGCARCSGTSTNLNLVSRLLADIAPTGMPLSIADRLTGAIAAESASRAAHLSAAASGAAVGSTDTIPGTESSEPGRAVPGRSDLPARRRRHSERRQRPVLSHPVLLRGLATAAGVALVAGTGYLLANSTAPQPGGTAGAPSQHAPRVFRSALGAGLHGGPVRVPYGQGAGASRLQVNSPASRAATVLTSDVNYTKSNLAAQVQKSVASAGAVSFAGTSASSAPVPAATAAPGSPGRELLGGLTVRQLTRCLTGLARGRRVLVADVARYLSKPATIIVFRSLTSAHILDVVIVGLACSASDAHVIARITVPLP